jgi:hypothetical protein
MSLIDRPDKAPVGADEPTALTIAPAVRNAIFHALGSHSQNALHRRAIQTVSERLTV